MLLRGQPDPHLFRCARASGRGALAAKEVVILLLNKVYLRVRAVRVVMKHGPADSAGSLPWQGCLMNTITGKVTGLKA